MYTDRILASKMEILNQGVDKRRITMQHLRRHFQLGFCALVVCLFLGARPARGQSAAPDPQPQCPDPTEEPRQEDAVPPDGCFYGSLHLTRTSYEIAKDVCTYDDPKNQEPKDKKTCLPTLIKELGKMSEDDRCKAHPTTALILHQEITEMVLTASLQVDGFLAEIDSETAHIRAVKDILSARQTTAINHDSLGNDAGTGGGAVGSFLALGAKTAMTAGTWVGGVSGVIGSGFGFGTYIMTARSPKGCFPDYNPDYDSHAKSKCSDLKQPVALNIDPLHNPKGEDPCDSGNKSTPKQFPHGCSPSMLSYLLFQIDPGFHSHYDYTIDKYLDRNREELGDEWGGTSNLGQLVKHGPKSELVHDADIERLITRNDSPRKLSIDDLTDRQNKLADVRAVASRINRDLSRLTEDLARGLRCPLPSVGN